MGHHQCSVLIPVADLFNHSPGRVPGAEYQWDDVSGDFVVKATAAHAAGEEIFISYGQRSNVELYRTYGFTLPPESEPCWSCSPSPEKSNRIFQGYVNRGVFSEDDQIHLHSTHVHHTLQTMIKQATKGNIDPRDVLCQICRCCMEPYEHDKKLKPALKALEHVRRATPTSAAWWAKLPDTACTLATDPVARIKMSE